MGQIRYFREEMCYNKLYKNLAKLEEDFQRYRIKLSALIVRGNDVLNACDEHTVNILKSLFTDVEKLGYMISLDEQILSKKSKLEVLIEDLHTLVSIKKELKKEIREMERCKNDR